MRILVLNLGAESLGEVHNALAGQGYTIVTENGLTVDDILKLTPEVLITEATPSDLSCCGMITQLKSRPDTRPLKIIMVVHGGALERARALDLGADDVISFPFESVEFAARIRTQFRERQPEAEVEANLHDAIEQEGPAETAVEALRGDMGGKRRAWLTPAIVGLSAAVVLATLTTVLSNRHRRRDTLQLQAEVARLNGGIVQQSELLRRT